MNSMPFIFDKNGNPHPHALTFVSYDRMKEKLTSIPKVTVRKNLSEKLDHFVGEFRNAIKPLIWEQWFGGSFTTTKKHPGDVDVVNLIDCETLNSAGATIEPFLTIDGEMNSKLIYKVDSYLVPIFPTKDPRYAITQDRKNYWTKKFGTDRSGNLRGILAVRHS